MKKYIGIDIGGTSVKLGLVEEDGNILAKTSVPTLHTRGAEAVIEDICTAAKKLIADTGFTVSDMSAIGIGCPGYIDSAKGVVVYNNNLHWENVPLYALVRAHIDLPVVASNDANVAALGESEYGAAKDYDNSVFITLGTGVGGGIIINNQLFEGNRSAGAELGHVKIGDKGNLCTCGRMDCWETYSSATALIRDTKIMMSKHKSSAMWEYVNNKLNQVDGKTAFECAKKGDRYAQEVIDNYILYLGDGLCNVVNVFRPEAILIGGGVCAQGDYLMKPLQVMIDANQYGANMSPNVRVMKATLGNDAGLLGAVALARTAG